jgi:hypothetical protein
MKRFRFALERLLRLRAQDERAARRKLALATTELRLAEGRAAVVRDVLEQCFAAERDEGPAARLARAMVPSLAAAERALHERSAAARRRLEAERAAYAAARQGERALARLRERRHGAWLAEVRAAQQAEIEELARLGRERIARQAGEVNEPRAVGRAASEGGRR